MDDSAEEFTEPDDITEEHDGFYYLGTAFVANNALLLENTVGIPDFYRHSSRETLNFLIETSTTIPTWYRFRVDILKLEISTKGGMVLWTCLVKTHYLRLVQRRWRNVLKERSSFLTTRRVTRFLDRRQRGSICRQLPVPGLKGMLSGLEKQCRK